MEELGSGLVSWSLQMFSLSTKVYGWLCSTSYCYCTGNKTKRKGEEGAAKAFFVSQKSQSNCRKDNRMHVNIKLTNLLIVPKTKNIFKRYFIIVK